jgi:hypothetical protein
MLGMGVSKLFDDGELYPGRISSGPELVKEKGSERLVMAWTILYDDGECEDLTSEEIKKWLLVEEQSAVSRPTMAPAKMATSNEADSKPKARAAAGVSRNNKHCTYDVAMAALCAMPGLSKDEVVTTLKAMKGPPYGLQAAVSAIHKSRDEVRIADDVEEENRFEPLVGTEVRKMMRAWTYYGTVTGEGQLDHEGTTRWEVTFDDGSEEDMTWSELLHSRASRPTRINPVRGRQLAMLELFSGCGMVSQEFAELKWRVRSVDSSWDSYATDKVSIMDINVPGMDEACPRSGKKDDIYELLDHFVPDFTWASPPCFTYSVLAADKHRKCDSGEFEKTADAHENNHYFVRVRTKESSFDRCD